MRVIAGRYKGRKLEPPVNYNVRPTSDKVKEALFDILMNDVYGSIVVDCFAGTGGLGIEALSRGAKRCYFIDSSRESIALIKKNIHTVGAEDDAVILSGDYSRGLARIHEKADIVLVDPPYDAGLYGDIMRRIEFLDLLSGTGIIIIEHDSRNGLEDNYGKYVRTKTKKYGKISLSFYRETGEGEE